MGWENLQLTLFANLSLSLFKPELPCINTSMDMYLLTKQSVLFMLITKSSQDLRVPQINQMYTYRQPKKIKWCDPKDLGQNFF